MKRKIFLSLLCGLLTFGLLTGCGNNNNDSNIDDNSNINDSNLDNSQITLDKVNTYTESPQSDFEITDYGNGVVEVSKYLGNDEIVVIPKIINGKQVTRLGAYIFANDYHPNTKAVRIPDSIKSIQTGAFGLNKSIEIVVMGSGLETINEGVFQECTNLHTVILNNGLKEIGNAAFSGCESLLSITIPESVINISRLAFYYSPESFTIIGTAGSVAETFAINNNINFKTK